jgi:hypothetical protein
MTQKIERTPANDSTEVAISSWRMAVAALTGEELLEWLSKSDGLSVLQALLPVSGPLAGTACQALLSGGGDILPVDDCREECQ